MSLFKETVKRVAELEEELTAEKARNAQLQQLNRNLESITQHARRDKFSASGRGTGYALPPDLNTLSDDDVEVMFEWREQEDAPRWSCQRCGAPIGWLGRALQLIVPWLHMCRKQKILTKPDNITHEKP